MPKPEPIAMPKPEPNVTADLDHLIDGAEGAGVTWYVLVGTAYPAPCIAFELPSNDPLPGNAIAAIVEFDHQFRTSAEVRRATIEWAGSIGAAFQEAGHVVMPEL